MALLVPLSINARTGVNYGPSASAFSVETNTDAQQVKLRIYKDGLGGKPVKTVNMKRALKGGTLWQASVKGDLKGMFYTFDVKYGGKFRGECAGVWATAVGVNGKRGAIVNMAETDPQGWSADKRPSIPAKDLILYEMHHRDFSIDESGDFTHRGKFLALTEPRAIGHLKALGVNAVHILPSFDYASVDETRLDEPQYNWGYDPVNYNVPEGGYSTDPYKPEVRINEFKQMVQALHRAGIKVILDVVYNHTWDIDGSNFQRTRPDYYYRKNADGTYSNGSGCGNETASEREGMRQFMVESVKYWVDEYHIDGFRFDLMGVHDIETMNLIRDEVNKIDPTIFIYGEGWSAGSCALPNEKLGMKANIPQMSGIAAFSDEIRDALRGPFSDDTKPGWLGGAPDCVESLKYGIVGCISHPQVDMSKVNYSKVPWAIEPIQMMSYVSCHDDMCLVDRLKASISSLKSSDGSLSNGQMDELIRLDLLAQTAVFTSQGVPFMLSGEELLRTKKGVHNSFESPDSINQLDWENLRTYPQVFNYYQRLIRLRKNHPAFRLGCADLVRKHLEFLDAPKEVVAFRLKNYAGRDDWRDIIVVLNATRKMQCVTIPKGSYSIVCRDGVIDEQGLGSVCGSEISVGAQSAIILHN